MTENEAFYIIGNIPIPLDDENYDICQYQEAKAIALEALEKIQQYKALGTVEELRIAKEKQIPKKVITSPCNSCNKELCDCECEHFAVTYRDDYRCPTCDSNGVYMQEYELRFDCCPNCGQKLDWSDEK